MFGFTAGQRGRLLGWSLSRLGIDDIDGCGNFNNRYPYASEKVNCLPPFQANAIERVDMALGAEALVVVELTKPMGFFLFIPSSLSLRNETS